MSFSRSLARLIPAVKETIRNGQFLSQEKLLVTSAQVRAAKIRFLVPVKLKFWLMDFKRVCRETSLGVSFQAG